MPELIEANWPVLLIAVLIGLAVAWFIFVATRRTRVETTRRDTLDEGAARSQRNQTLIDAAPAVAREPASPAPPIPPVVPDALAGVGVAIEAAVEDAEIAAESSPEPQPTAGEAFAEAPLVPAPADDDLTRIKGLGPKLRDQLHALGITSFAQIAAWTEADVLAIDAQLGRFQGRIERDNWRGQARLLAGGDTAGYEQQFGRL